MTRSAFLTLLCMLIPLSASRATGAGNSAFIRLGDEALITYAVTDPTDVHLHSSYSHAKDGVEEAVGISARAVTTNRSVRIVLVTVHGSHSNPDASDAFQIEPELAIDPPGNLLYENHAVGAHAQLNDTVHIAGWSGPGSIQIDLSVLQIDLSGGPNATFELDVFDGLEPYSLTEIVGDSMQYFVYRWLFDETVPSSFDVSLRLTAEFDTLQKYGSPYFNMDAEIHSIAVLDAEGEPLAAPHQLISSHGRLAPPSSTLDFTDPLTRHIQWPSLTNRFYQVEYTTNLAEHAWHPLTEPLTGSGGIMSVSVPGHKTMHFFRLLELR